MPAAAAALPTTPTPEDSARAAFYALLARLYADGPDANLLAAIARAEKMAGDSPLALAWNRLTQASGAMEAGAAAQEYTDLFVGVGKSEVDLHASHWRLAGMGERSLVELRSDLARLGLSRRPEATMIEDHLSALCETMRILIAGAPGIPPREIATQRDFFTRYIASWVFDCCDAIRESTIANYYAQVAEWTHKYMAVERDALAMD